MKLLAISGSLRATSSNTNLLHAAVALAPEGIAVELYDGLADLPHFNPDDDHEKVPPSVKHWRAALRAADGVIFSTPEYAHGVPGVLKNALDWIVGSGELASKPVTLFNASPRGTYAQASLKETLSVMASDFISEAAVTLNLLGTQLSAKQIAADAAMAESIRRGLRRLARCASMPGYSIQPARAEHLPALPEIELAAMTLFDGYVPDTLPADVTEQRVFAHAAERGLLWVALAGDTPVGFALVEMLADGRPHLEEMDVHPAHGRLGLGTALVRAVLRWVVHSGYETLTLTTFRDVPWNLPFYARLGFIELPQQEFSPELLTVVEGEARRGLDPKIRATMLWSQRGG